MFKHIIIAIDGSDSALHAARTGCDIAQKYGARVTLVHAPQVETAALATGAMAGYHALDTAPSHDELIAAGQEVVDAAAAEARKLGCETASEVRIGDAAMRVVEIAKDTKADLIVCGRRGLGALAGLFMGSTSQKIQARAHCAVLTVE